MWSEWRNEGNKESEDVAEDEAHETTNYAKNNRFEEELEKDIAAAGAYGFADADFASTLRDGDEHDVHNANAADDERDASNQGEHVGHDGEKGASWVKVFGARDNLVTLIAFLGLLELLVDSTNGVWDDIGGFSTNVDLLNLDRRFEGASKVNVDKNRVIKIYAIEVDWVFELVEDADDHELLIIVGESAGGCFGGAEDLFGNVIAKNCNVLAEAIIEELATF